MSAGSVEVSDEDKRRHREVEKSLKEVRIQFHSFSRIYANVLSQYRVLTTLSSGEAEVGLTGQGT
jgi:hypothetical protein